MFFARLKKLMLKIDVSIAQREIAVGAKVVESE